MEFIPNSALGQSAVGKSAIPRLAEARQRSIREIGVAAVAAALGIVEDAGAHGPIAPRLPPAPTFAMPLAQKAA